MEMGVVEIVNDKWHCQWLVGKLNAHTHNWINILCEGVQATAVTLVYLFTLIMFVCYFSHVRGKTSPVG